MSDDEYYSQNNDSDSDNDSEIITKSKNSTLIKPKSGLMGNNNLKTSGPNVDDDSESDEDNENDEDDEDLNQIGGIGDDDDQEEIMSNVSSDDDEPEEEDEEEEEVGEEIGEENVNKKPIKSKSKKPVQIDLPSDDEDEDYDDSYLQKFDTEVTKNYINDFHPECLIQNYDEISKLTTVVRDANNIIIDPLHKTIPFLTKYEKARVLGQRAKQIEVGAKPFISVPENVIDSYVIAELELQQKRIPFIIRRPIPHGGFEYWNIRDLEVIGF
jgi:DNA-directed RNA polymerase subunit K/omega